MSESQKMQSLLYAFGRLVCGMKKHHIDGHKFKHAGKYVYQCSRCGRLRDGPVPVKRVKKGEA